MNRPVPAWVCLLVLTLELSLFFCVGVPYAIEEGIRQSKEELGY